MPAPPARSRSASQVHHLAARELADAVLGIARQPEAAGEDHRAVDHVVERRGSVRKHLVHLAICLPLVSMPIITLTTDFGTRDGYVGAVKGVLTWHAPGATIIDIAHDVPMLASG
jgi:hypothetical protein